MSDPDRLVECSDSEVERLLLQAGRGGAPRGAKRRALAAATGVIAASTLTAGNAAGAAALGKAAAGAKIASVLSLKWIAVIGLASVAVVAGTVAVRARYVAAPEAAVGPAHAERAPSPRTGTSALSTRVSPAAAPGQLASAPAEASAVAPPPVAPAAAPAGARASAASGSTAAAELALLDEVRSALAGGDPARALSILESYPARFPRGVMGPEASVLRVQALVEAGDRSAAKRAADSFLKANPTSPYAQRIESLLGSPNP
jgi:hypothetical protein